MAALAPVRRRQQARFVLQATVAGLLVGSIAGVVVGAGRLFAAWPVSYWLAAALLAGGPALGALVGLLIRKPWKSAATAVDAHYRLKDRSLTALEFAAKPEAGDLHHLQIEDAVRHLKRVEPGRVVSFKIQPALPVAAVLAMAAAVTLLLWPVQAPEVLAGPQPAPDNIVAEANALQQHLADLDEEAKKDDNKELQQLVKELLQKAEEMKQPGVDEREALAKLAEMEAAVQQQQAQFNLAVVDGQLQSLGAAMGSATALEGAGKALQEGKLDKAAEQLEKMEEPKLERKEAKTVEEKLKQVAEKMGEVGLGQLSSAVSDLAEAVKSGNGKASKASKVIAKEVKNQARRKKLNDLLNGELDRLNEGKCNCQCNSLVTGKKPQKSTSPSGTFGMTTSGNVQGEKTGLLGQRQQVDLTGNPGEGPSEVETTSSPEARQQSRAAYQEKYKQFKKESDAVLDSEPIPLGQRQMIRKYFELIRPSNADLDDAKDPKAMSKPGK